MFIVIVLHGPLARYVKLRVAHAPGMPGTFSPPQLVSDPDMHHGTCVTHVPWCMPGPLTSGFLWSRLRENVPGIPGACATGNFTYLVRGPCNIVLYWTMLQARLDYMSVLYHRMLHAFCEIDLFFYFHFIIRNEHKYHFVVVLHLASTTPQTCWNLMKNTAVVSFQRFIMLSTHYHK